MSFTLYYSTYYSMAGTVLSSVDTAMNKTETIPVPVEPMCVRVCQGSGNR